MQTKVKRVTNMLLDEAGGSTKLMSELVANISNQRVIRPFLPVTTHSPQTRFGINVLQTCSATKKHSQKPGGRVDRLRRCLIVAGAEGPLSNMPVSW